MLRFDYLENKESGTVNITVVSINDKTQVQAHSLVGRLILTAEEWRRLRTAITKGYTDWEIDWIPADAVSARFFRFEPKNQEDRN